MGVYENETFDFVVTKGDFINLPFSFYDPDGVEVDLSLFFIKFTLRDPISRDPILALQKEHIDSATGGGIFEVGDTAAWAGLNLTRNNQIQVVLNSIDTDTLRAGVYAFDIEFGLVDDQDYHQKKTVVHGTLSVVEEVTANVYT
jgi:hypothetical protein